jgi:hypothetical protein
MRASEHKMLKQMSQTCAIGVLVASTHLVEDVHRHESRCRVAIGYNFQAIFEFGMLIFNHWFWQCFLTNAKVSIFS